MVGLTDGPRYTLYRTEGPSSLSLHPARLPPDVIQDLLQIRRCGLGTSGGGV